MIVTLPSREIPAVNTVKVVFGLVSNGYLLHALVSATAHPVRLD